VDISQVIGPDSLVLEDEGLFSNADIARVLERFPFFVFRIVVGADPHTLRTCP
jgi:phage terminase large subunit-like protein